MKSHCRLVVMMGLFATAQGCGADEEPERQRWEELAGVDWQLASGTEEYLCVRTTLREDVVVGGIEPIGPPGTHHTTLSLAEPTEPDGVVPCDGLAALLGNPERGVWASGVNTRAAKFPPGVAMLLPAGKQLLLHLHLFNATKQTLSGRSGVAIQRRATEQVEHWAEGALMGTFAVSLPPGRTTRSVGGCTFKEAGTIYAVMPHMHRLGSHMKIVAERAGQPELVIHDDEFRFEEQSMIVVPEVALAAGDRLRVECTHRNDTAELVGFGESTGDEMCFAATAYYPARGEIVCVE